MPAQAPTPRTTRNSRGLRRPSGIAPDDSCLGDSARVSRRRRRQSSGRPTRANLLARLPIRLAPPAPPATPAPPAPPAASALPAPPAPLAAARPPIFPPPVVLAPPTRFVSSPPPAPAPPAPATPVRYRQRYLTRFIDVTPSTLPAPTPASPGEETRYFRLRRDAEGEERFARELWIAIRNDHHMRGCWCGPPNIYSSREEAEAAAGHLRFYVVGTGPKNLRVLQKKDDLRWHCICGNNEYHEVYKGLLNKNGKRPAEDCEVDLIAQNQGSKDDGKSVDRVVPAPEEPIPAEEESSRAPETPQEEAPAPARSMWARTFGIIGRAVATMGSPLATLYGKLRHQFRGDAYETVDTRRKAPDNDNIVVKRVKRRAPTSPTNQDGDVGFDRLIWTDDPTKRIGLDRIQHLARIFATQLDSIQTGNLIGGPSVAAIQMQIQDGQDLAASIGIHMFREFRHGPVLPDESDEERAEKLIDTLKKYEERLRLGIEFMQIVYDRELFEDLKKTYPTPPRRLPLGSSMFRQNTGMLGEFLCFLRSLDSVCKIDKATLETICMMIVDANAIHKQEMVPSYVELEEHPTENMPGFFPEEPKPPVMEDIPADELDIQPFYDFKFPEPGPCDWEEQINPGDYRLVPEPKGILKPSKEWGHPTSPRYVATPEKKRKLAFKSPVSQFIPPAHIPARIMTPRQADRILKAKLKAELLRDEHSARVFEASRTVTAVREPHDTSIHFKEKGSPEDLEPEERALEREDREMGLTHYSRKYGRFLNRLYDDLEKRAEAAEQNRLKTTVNLPPRRRMLQSRYQSADAPQGGGATCQTCRKEARPRTLEEFFAEDEDDLAISTTKLEELLLERQIREEFEAGVRRSIEEKRKREEEEALREKFLQQEQERRRIEEERRREQEAQRRAEAEQFAALTGLRQPARPLITALSEDWNIRVANAARANPTAELVKTLEGQPLTRRDFEEKLLPPTAWLNDNVIIGSILHVADYVNRAKGATDQEPKCAAFTSYFWPRLLSHGPGGCGRLLRRAGVRKANLLNIDTILIPICDQSHWTLAVIRPEKRTVSHIDSMRGGSGDESVKTKLLELVRFILEDQFVEAEWRGVDYEAPRQTNGWDCGVFTITNAMCMALGLNPKFSYTESEMTLQRRRLAAMLLNEGFKGEFSLDGY
ncbi:95d01a63-f569-43ef-9778-2c70f44d6f9a [Thermothielavioides terrestris]|uniref:95d01a63-f569-43ef-9778-2c70f44d6f9a n=1 Tax=Thermothielavioides terrestris TaxID=2587410 RepID=A0A3S4BBP1_9PEZI|nr:95d01a63-f569-43ef-9778-2c70f44d6f9a [Thermothielavioides terrestris]